MNAFVLYVKAQDFSFEQFCKTYQGQYVLLELSTSAQGCEPL